MLPSLLSLYHTLHASIHAKNAHLKVHHCISRESISLAWVTPLFELYCVAGPHASRNALAQSANKVVQWVRREEERVFIIGGAVSKYQTFFEVKTHFIPGILSTILINDATKYPMTQFKLDQTALPTLILSRMFSFTKNNL